ncbi:hypothetical protein ACFLZJ_01585 [Nanoarchaeota archaeon]
MKKGDVAFLIQLVNALEQAEHSLEQAYESKDYDSFNKSKKLILQIQKRIEGVIQ